LEAASFREHLPIVEALVKLAIAQSKATHIFPLKKKVMIETIGIVIAHDRNAIAEHLLTVYEKHIDRTFDEDCVTIVVCKGDLKLVRRFLIKGKGTVYADDSIYDAFALNCSLGNLRICRAFFDTGSLELDAEYGVTRYPLHAAISANSKALIKLLLDLGANPNGAKQRHYHSPPYPLDTAMALRDKKLNKKFKTKNPLKDVEDRKEAWMKARTTMMLYLLK
jgi:hypothetical protein